MKKFFGVLALIGFIIILGSVGKADYMDAVGGYYSFSDILKQCMIGLFLMLPFSVKCMKEW